MHLLAALFEGLREVGDFSCAIQLNLCQESLKAITGPTIFHGHNEAQVIDKLLRLALCQVLQHAGKYTDGGAEG